MGEKVKFDRDLETAVIELGGWRDYHTHLDRANTCGSKYLGPVGIDFNEAAALPLSVKQDLVGDLHRGEAYTSEDLYQRMKDELLRRVIMRQSEVISFIDATPDIGLTAIEEVIRLKEELKDRLTLRIAVSPIFGFKNPGKNPDRWEIYRQAAQKDGVDILGGLPCRDEELDRIGFENHIQRIIELGQVLKKEVHFQLDQDNRPEQGETKKLVELVRRLGSPEIPNKKEPTIWAVHVISPSCYPEREFFELIEGLKECNIGVICCPSAAISMLELRSFSAPIHNSIARILEIMKEGIPVRLGTDNTADIFIPNGRGSVHDEVWVAANAVRFYHVEVWAKIATGFPLNNMDRELIARALYQKRKSWDNIKADPL